MISKSIIIPQKNIATAFVAQGVMLELSKFIGVMYEYQYNSSANKYAEND